MSDAMPDSARYAECHTMPNGEAFPNLCMADDCPAKPWTGGSPFRAVARP